MMEMGLAIGIIRPGRPPPPQPRYVSRIIGGRQVTISRPGRSLALAVSPPARMPPPGCARKPRTAASLLKQSTPELPVVAESRERSLGMIIRRSVVVVSYR